MNFLIENDPVAAYGVLESVKLMNQSDATKLNRLYVATDEALRDQIGELGSNGKELMDVLIANDPVSAYTQLNQVIESDNKLSLLNNMVDIILNDFKQIFYNRSNNFPLIFHVDVIMGQHTKYTAYFYLKEGIEILNSGGDRLASDFLATKHT